MRIFTFEKKKQLKNQIVDAARYGLIIASSNKCGIEFGQEFFGRSYVW